MPRKKEKISEVGLDKVKEEKKNVKNKKQNEKKEVKKTKDETKSGKCRSKLPLKGNLEKNERKTDRSTKNMGNNRDENCEQAVKNEQAGKSKSKNISGRKRKSTETLKEESDNEGSDCVDGDITGLEVSKKPKLEAWPLRKNPEILSPVKDDKSHIKEIIKKDVRKVGKKSKSSVENSELQEFDTEECKPKKVQKKGNSKILPAIKTANDNKTKVTDKKSKKEDVEKVNKQSNSDKNKNKPTTEKLKKQTTSEKSVKSKKQPSSGKPQKQEQRQKIKLKPSTKNLKKKDRTLVGRGKDISDVDVMSDQNSDDENIILAHNHIKSGPKKKIDMGDVTSVLLMMEGKSQPVGGPKPSTSGMQGDDEKEDFMVGSSEEEESDWEDVQALHGSPVKSQVPSGPIEITVEGPHIMKKRKKKTFDVKAYFQRQLNRFQKEKREHMHKVHFMCLLSRGMYLNRLCMDPVYHAQALSVLPPQFTSVSKKAFNINLLGRIVMWYRDNFPVQAIRVMAELTMEQRLEESFKVSTVLSYVERALILVILLRTLGLMTRFVMSLQPMSMKTTKMKESTKNAGRKIKHHKEKRISPKSEKEPASSKNSVKNGKKKLKGNEETQSKYFKTKNEKLRTRGSKVKPVSYKDNDEDNDSGEEFIPSSESEDEEDERMSKTGKRMSTSVDNSSGDDFEEESFSPRSPVNLLRLSAEKKNRKIVSSDSDEYEPKGCNTWAEVYLEAEEKWISIDCMQCKSFDKPHVIESQAAKPVHYVFSFDNNGYIKDITPRYASKWLTETRKLRIAEDWLEETITPFKCPDSEIREKEDDDIKANLVSKPLPSSVGELKNHPLYALKRHLLKFEAIYPNTAVPLGYLKNNEPIYARECVHTLHSRENWLKEGRAVRVKEEPYKMVKSRARWNRKKENPDELDLEIFGYWQTEEYIPPPAVDGKVPRNGYGNIEIFKPSMIPAGTVHLKLPGLNKVARKLDIDCVPAMTGWDSHSGYSHPVLDGFIVCEEFKDILLAAWDEDQEIQKQRETEKREKRVIQNWQLLTKGLLIKEKLKRKYLLQSDLHEEEKLKKGTKKKGENSDDLKHSWPMNKQGSESLSTAKHFTTETM